MSSPGWYPDPSQSGGLRYWDGRAWTQHRSSPLSEIAREEILSQVVSEWVHRHGARVESQSRLQAVVVVGTPVNHGLHGIVTLLTCGVWLPIWAILAIFTPVQKRIVLTVNRYGVVTQRGVR